MMNAKPTKKITGATMKHIVMITIRPDVVKSIVSYDILLARNPWARLSEKLRV